MASSLPRASFSKSLLSATYSRLRHKVFISASGKSVICRLFPAEVSIAALQRTMDLLQPVLVLTRGALFPSLWEN
jgi:hypothetical protein